MVRQALGHPCPARILGNALVIGLLIALAGFIGSTSVLASSGASKVVTYALGPGQTPAQVFPIIPSPVASPTEIAYFVGEMYEPLYWYQKGSRVGVNTALSLADLPKFSVVNGHTVATITLKNYDWSDGAPITTRDVEFWMRLLVANKDDWWDYSAGEFPDNVIAEHYTSEHTFSLVFNKVYNTSWILYDELYQVVPIPQQVWDRTSASSPIGNHDLTTKGAAAVYKYLEAAGSDESTMASNPLFQVVDGPWKLSKFSSATSYALLRRNTEPDSPGPRPKFAELALEPFTTDAAEFDALRAGTVDYGYIPSEDVSQVAYFKREGYNVSAEYSWSITYLPLNLDNTNGAGVILKQLYVRQALQHLVNVPQYIKDVYHGYAQACYGPVPCTGDTEFVQSAELHDPYPYDPAAAKRLLTQHGWKVEPSGTTTCTHPGGSAHECGAGIPSGAQMSFTALYTTGLLDVQNEMEALKSAFSGAGIQVALKSAPYFTVLDDIDPCVKATGVDCAWDLGNWQNPNSWNYQGYPSGEIAFSCGAYDNSGNYCSATNQANIAASLTGSGLKPLYRYENYLETQVPVLWLPNPPSQLSAVSPHLHGVVQSPDWLLNTQSWTLSG
jgi:peptide/nickel transport system substrate-binding protein